jgi:hypothetical protein
MQAGGGSGSFKLVRGLAACVQIVEYDPPACSMGATVTGKLYVLPGFTGASLKVQRGYPWPFTV